MSPTTSSSNVVNPDQRLMRNVRMIGEERRNLIGALWHGTFLALGMALTQPTTVIAAFIADLTGSLLWVGGLTTLLTVAGALPQIFVARFIEPRPYKRPILLIAIYLRVVSWGLLALLIFLSGAQNPIALIWALVGLLTVFYAGGGLGGVPYTDIIGKIIPAQRRGIFFSLREALSGPFAVGAALLARQILAQVAYPNNYALLFLLAATSLAVASIGFWLVREPPRADKTRSPLPWRAYGKQLWRTARRLRSLVVVQLLTGLSLLALPFYITYAREVLHAPDAATGWFLLIQVIGGVLANLLWGRLISRYGCKTMLRVCATLSTLNPLLALLLARWGWQGVLFSFFIVGATIGGRAVGFSSMLLAFAPPNERPTYAGLNTLLSLPVAAFSLLGGLILTHTSYTTLFIMSAVGTASGWLVLRFIPDPREMKALPATTTY
jgi:MFS family permease